MKRKERREKRHEKFDKLYKYARNNLSTEKRREWEIYALYVFSWDASQDSFDALKEKVAELQKEDKGVKGSEL